MSTEPSRRRIRRAAQTRHVPHPAAELPVETAQPLAESAVVTPPDPAQTAPGHGPDLAPPGSPAAPEPSVPPERDGSWLPAGIVLTVMAGLLLCAGLVLIAARQ